jgi:ribosome maturation factor RimP
MDDLYATLQPVVSALGLELVDVELHSGVLQVTVDRDGGVDLDALTQANRAASARLDELDPIPGRYALEVSSPGVERRLRTSVHFARAIGETVTVKTRPQVPGERRRQGRLVSADEDGFDLAVDGAAEPVRLAYTDVDRARTVFEWGPGPRPGATPADRRGAGAAPEKTRKAPAGKKRKQVASR